MYIGTAKDVQARKNELLELVASGQQTDSQIRSAELDIVFGIADYISGGAWTVVDSKSGARSVALGNMPHAKSFAGEVSNAFDIIEEVMGTKEDGTPKVRRYSQITGKSETMYLLLGKLAHPWVREGFGLVYDKAVKSYGCSNYFSGFTSNFWAPFVSSVKKVAIDKAFFRINDLSLANMKSEEISDEILEKLQGLKNQGFAEEAQIARVLQETLGDTIDLRPILTHAKTSDLKEKALELLGILKILTIDKEEQSGNNILDMEKRIEEFKAALSGSSFSGVGIDYKVLTDAPNKSLVLRDSFNDFAGRQAKTKKKIAQAVTTKKDSLPSADAIGKISDSTHLAELIGKVEAERIALEEKMKAVKNTLKALKEQEKALQAANLDGIAAALGVSVAALKQLQAAAKKEQKAVTSNGAQDSQPTSDSSGEDADKSA